MSNAAARHMPSVEDYRERLANLQGSWDTLSLLSHLSGDATDMGGTREAFESLTGELVKHLAAETHRKVLLGLKARSQIAIDIIARNLFERTADIGFLSTDDDLRQYLRLRHQTDPSDAAQSRTLSQSRDRLRTRFREYVAKYSVYQDVILLSPDGEVLARLDDRTAVTHSRDPLVAEAVATRSAYVETYRRFDLLPDQERSLVYSFRVVDAGRTLGVLCLCFRLEDEVAGIFSQLREPTDWSIFTLLDAQGRVIASSDPWQVPLGAAMPTANDTDGRLIRFGGREYLAATCRTQGFQGYMGPGWCGHAMIPVEHAFARDDAGAAGEITPALLEQLRQSTTIFSDGLRRIPLQAEQIQRELNRAVWNGNIRLAKRADATVHFARVLLWEIGNAGRRTQATFEQSINDLQITVVSAILDDAQLLASLGADVLDRNLYERANDCRWWALNATLMEQLSGGMPDRDAVTSILQHINSLYTVYHDIILFDSHRQVVAVSNTSHRRRVGERLNDAWCSDTLALRSSQDFSVSAFAPSAFYGERPTLVYGAAVRSAAGRTVGGIGIVFDAQPQFDSILRDALPVTEGGSVLEGAISVFVDSNLRVIAASSRYGHGDIVPLPREVLSKGDDQSAHVVTIDGMHYAVGARHTSGYREYRATSLWCLVLIPLGVAATCASKPRQFDRQSQQRQVGGTDLRNEQVIDIATFNSNGQWLGLLREQVVEAVGGVGLRPVPNTPAWHAGLLMYRDQPIPVVDLARLMDNASSTQGTDVVVVRAGNDAAIGLRVDDLADIPAIPVSRLLPMADAAQFAGAGVVDRAVRPERPDDPLLLIINLEQLLLLTRTLYGSSAKPVHKGDATKI